MGTTAIPVDITVGECDFARHLPLELVAQLVTHLGLCSVQLLERMLVRFLISVVTNNARPLSTVSSPSTERNWIRK